MTEQPAEKRVETVAVACSSRTRTTPASTALIWGSDDGLWIQDDSSVGKRR